MDSNDILEVYYLEEVDKDMETNKSLIVFAYFLKVMCKLPVKCAYQVKLLLIICLIIIPCVWS